MPTPKPTRSQAPNTLPIQYTPFTEKHFTTKEGIASFNQQMSQIVNALNRGTGQAGPVVIPAGVNVAGGSVTGLGTPSNESDAVPLGHANSQFGYAAQQGQLDIGKPYALKGLTYCYQKVQNIPSGPTSGSNANGYWVKDSAGHIVQWGKITGSGSVATGLAVPFATDFTDAASISVNATSITIFGHGIGFISIQDASVTTSQFTVEVGAEPTVDGLYWIAEGY